MNHNTEKSFSEKVTIWRNAIAKLLAFKSLMSVMAGSMLILWLLFECYISSDWPFSYKDDWPMNHGPWRYTFGIVPNDRADTLNNCLQIIIFSLDTAFVAMILRCNRLTFRVFVICAFIFYLSMHYLYWLID
jgi:hypothetical protein